MRKSISSPSATAVGPYSHAVEVDGPVFGGIASGGIVYCSGQTPIDPVTGRLAAGGIGAQTNQCLDNLLSVLSAGGLSLDDVVKVNVFLTDMDDFAEMNTAYAGRFSEPFPARTTIGVASLPLGAHVEIELVARRSIPSEG